MVFIMQPQFKLVCYTSNWVYISGTKEQHRVRSHYWHSQRIKIYQQETQHQTGWCSSKTLYLYSGDASFKYQLGHCLFSWAFQEAFLISST